MTPPNADAIQALQDELAHQRAVFGRADRRVTKLGAEIAEAEGERQQARIQINCLNAQLRDFGVE